jgi:fatty-acyl-CoA synthase
VPVGIHSYQDLLEHGARISHNKLNERQASINPDSAVAIFFTSGTTGQPKAATLTNFNMVNMSQAVTQHLGQYLTRLCAPIPMFHIFSEVVGVLSAATSKCQIVFPAILPDPVATMRAIHEEKCTALIGAPIIYSDILNHPDRKKYDLSSLVFSAIGASPVHVDFLRRLEKEIPIKRIAQVYGMTENAAILASSMWTGEENETRRLSSIGRCMQRLEIKVADPEGNPVPIGQQGEICGRGFPIMVGYYGDPQKTSEAITSSGWLRTGDEGTMDADGYLYYIGRQKEMIIRGGVNIYPVEIENVINEHPSVDEVQVFSIPDTRYGEEICAWIKLKPNALTCQPRDIVKYLSDKIAFFKIPKHIRIVDKFLMTPTGKVQKFKMSESMVNELKMKNGQT